LFRLICVFCVCHVCVLCVSCVCHVCVNRHRHRRLRGRVQACRALHYGLYLSRALVYACVVCVCVCMRMCVCLHTHIRPGMCVCWHAFVCVFVCVFAFVCACLCVYIYICIYIYVYIYIHISQACHALDYRVASIGRIDKIIGLFCKRAL